jgi:hypothetical protein
MYCNKKINSLVLIEVKSENDGTAFQDDENQ